MESTKPHSNGKGKADAVPGKDAGSRPAPGARLAAAFEAVERFPVLIEARSRVMQAATTDSPRVGELVEAIESDVGLTIAVLRYANRGGVEAGAVGSIPAALQALKPSGVLAIAGTAPAFDFFEPNGGWELKPERFRVHALATQQAADQIGRAVGWPERDELAVAALLHDVGRLVISKLHPGRKSYFDSVANTPEQRIREERDQLGIDHALVGGVLARRWNVPQQIAVAIERHHAQDAEGLAAMVALADMVAHYSQGQAVRPRRRRRARAALRAPQPAPGRSAGDRALPPFRARAGRPQAPLRGHGLQADRRGNAALGLDHPHPPAQRLRQDRRGRPRAGCSHRARSRLDIGPSARPRERRLLDQRLAQGDRYCVRSIPSTQAGEGVLGVGLDRFLAE